MRFSGRRLTMQNLRASSCGVQETSGHHSCRSVHFDEYRNRASQRAGSRDHRQCCNGPRRPSAGNTPKHALALRPQHRRNHRAIDSFHSTRPAAPVGSAAEILQSAESTRTPRTQQNTKASGAPEVRNYLRAAQRPRRLAVTSPRRAVPPCSARRRAAWC